MASFNLLTDIRCVIVPAPIKTNGAERMAPELLARQAEAARACLVSVDYKLNRGTCGDERPREYPEPRPSVFGGPNVYALGVAELTGYFADDDQSSGEERLVRVTGQIEAGGFKSGGHKGCAANSGFGTWMRIIAEHPELMKDYARGQKGDAYNDTAMNVVIGYAQAVVASGRYDDWSEDVLARVLGDEADEAIETLIDVPHEGKTLVRNRTPNTTVDQTDLYGRSVVGKGSFVHDDPYADALEHVVTSGNDAARKKVEAEHAREVILAAVALAVPNEEIYQLELLPAA